MPQPAPSSGRRRLLDQPRRSVSPWAWVALAVVLFVLAFGLVTLLRNEGPARTAAGAPIVPHTSTAAQAPPTVTPSVTPSTTVSADLPEGSFAGDSADPYIVGVNLPDGRYTTPGAVDPRTPGTWERRRFTSATSRYEGVADGSSTGPTTVVLRVGDVFTTRGFRPWHKAS